MDADSRTARKREWFDASGDANGRLVRGVCIYSGAGRLAELAIRIGFDTCWIDMEHGPADFALAEQTCAYIESAGGAATIRLPDGQRHHVLRALEIGARIVIVPLIDTADEARRLVEYGKFPPLGKRGFNTRSRGVGYGLAPADRAFRDANERTHLFAQIETMRAVENLEAICAVEGLSGIFIGPGDLSVSTGCTGELSNDRLIRIVADCIRRARARSKHAGILVTPGRMLDAALAAGANLVFAGGDVTDLAVAWSELLAGISSSAQQAGIALSTP